MEVIIKKVGKNQFEPLIDLLFCLTGKEPDYKCFEKNFQLVLSNSSYHVLGAFVENKLVGSVTGIVCMDLVGNGQPFMVLENMIVNPSQRGRGVGKCLMQSIESLAKSLHVSYIIFVSSSEKVGAHTFYQKMGYEPDKVKGFKKRLDYQ